MFVGTGPLQAQGPFEGTGSVCGNRALLRMKGPFAGTGLFLRTQGPLWAQDPLRRQSLFAGSGPECILVGALSSSSRQYQWRA